MLPSVHVCQLVHWCTTKHSMPIWLRLTGGARLAPISTIVPRVARWVLCIIAVLCVSVCRAQFAFSPTQIPTSSPTSPPPLKVVKVTTKRTQTQSDPYCDAIRCRRATLGLDENISPAKLLEEFSSYGVYRSAFCFHASLSHYSVWNNNEMSLPPQVHRLHW